MNDQDLVTLQRVLEGKIETPKKHRPALWGTVLPGELVAVTPSGTTDLDAPRVDPLANLPGWARRLPRTNAALNALATMLLLTGFVAIKAKNVSLHKRLMLFAFAVSIAFLGCYLTYHFALHKYTGEHGKKFFGTPALTKVYYTILITHVILATAVPVLASMTIWKGLKAHWESHRRWAKVTLPIWLYVSVTGVIIYWMLYHVSG
jgi:protein SCO1